MIHRPLGFVLLLLALEACSQPSEPIDKQNTVVQDGIAYTLTLGTSVYSLSDTVAGQFTVENQSSVRHSFKFSYVQQYGYRLRDQNGFVALSEPAIVAPALSAFDLERGERRVYELCFLLRDHTGRWMTPGRYRLEMFLLDGSYPSVSMQITIL